MRPIALSLSASLLIFVAAVFIATQSTRATPPRWDVISMSEGFDSRSLDAEVGQGATANTSPTATPQAPSRSLVLVASLTVFVLSIFVGFEIIAKVPPTLHTPLMSGSNAISGITVVGAIIAAGYKETGVGSLLGLVAIVLAMINVVGGFVVTHRMLLMFKKR